jgi:phytanoyl-CoA hydroxylase
MNTNLSQEQINEYRSNGFVVIDDFLTSDELEMWREAVDEAVSARGTTKLAGREQDARWQSSDNYYDKVFVQRINLWQDSEKVRKLMLDPRLGKMAAELAGVEGIRIWHDQALIKQPWGNPTGWHLDNPYWSFFSRDAISIWVALDDATLHNGCLYFIPGSHKSATFDNAGIGQNIGDLFKVYSQWSTLEAVPAPMKAGSCSFHNGLVAHGAGANMTPRSRRAMTCAYLPDGSTFNGQQNVLPESYFSSLTIGDVLDNDEQNPLIHPVRQV